MTFNPVYDFVVGDSRYADFVKTCNEWRVKQIKIKFFPAVSVGITALVSIPMSYCIDDAAPY